MSVTFPNVPNAPAMSKVAFQGQFLVTEIHHYGSYRDPNADSWVTAFVAAAGGAPQ